VPELDVVIVTRGGGGSEDLGAFNDERVARAIAACKVPVVTGVGHDVDETIADLVADLRAATPSNAAERVVPELGALQAQLGDLHRRLEQALESRIDRGRLGLERFGRRLSDPRHGLAGVRHRFQGLAAGLERATRQRVATERLRVTGLERRLGRVDPRAALARDRATLEGLERRLLASGKPLAGRARRELAASETRLRVAARPRLERARALFGEATARLGALSPLSILARGYAIALHAPSGRALVSSSDAAVGDAIDLRLSAGSLRATVVEVRDP
jgi:exodeoxyribonuclease VII large subunit